MDKKKIAIKLKFVKVIDVILQSIIFRREQNTFLNYKVTFI